MSISPALKSYNFVAVLEKDNKMVLHLNRNRVDISNLTDFYFFIDKMPNNVHCIYSEDFAINAGTEYLCCVLL